MQEQEPNMIEDITEDTVIEEIEIASNEDLRYLDRVRVVDEKHRPSLNESFGWIGDLKLVKVDDQYALKDPAGGYVISDTTIHEKAFVNRWLDQFALGFVGPTNYFDARAWGELTHGHQRGVVIVDDKGEAIFVIPPLSRIQLNETEQYVLDLAHKNFTNASSAEQTGDAHRAKEIVRQTSELIKTHISDETITVTHLIPEWFYTKYGVVPYIKRSMIYCRDMYGLNPDIKEDWEMAKSVFTNIHNKVALTQEQLIFMEILTEGEFTPPDYVPVNEPSEISPESPSNSEDFDPFEN
ncbi:hypothetical protein HWC35_gp120 [Vibrio phage USC-1]|uniref:Uncharacterized protein n=2 Tax=Aphroditevirus USC1 TaxID=2846605 RepID=A0A514A2K9_9CAUD|nr:hypothetical protein HWC35_gp120 [Vibrio phage USC-1]QCW23214.1 hypothetical protein [Vibrio phage 5 TSL-2019]QDH47514.1 hypothetical protein [Vibrio phage USC-1]